MAYFDQYTQPRSRPLRGSQAFNAAPMNLGAPTGPGLYAQGLQHAQNYNVEGFQGGLVNNYGAGLGYAHTGYMPNKTVGGAWGNPGAQPLPFERGPMQQAMPLQMAPNNQQGYMQQMAAQNPQGRFFQGALPALGTSFGGQTRPMFMGMPQGPMGFDQSNMASAQYGLGAKGYARRDAGNGNPQWYNPSSSGAQATQAAAAMFNARGGGLAQRQDNYFDRVTQNGQMRNFNVQQKAYAKGDARARRMGNISNDEFMQMNVPGYAVQGLQNSNSRGWMDVQSQMAMANNQLGWGKLNAENHQQQFGNQAAILGQLPAMVQSGAMSQQQANALAQHFMGQWGGMTGGLPQGKNAVVPPVGTPQSEQFRSSAMTNPAQAERDLIAKGATPAEARNAVRDVNPNHGRPGILSAISDSPLGWPAGALGSNIDPYGPWGGFFGVNPPPLARGKASNAAAAAKWDQQHGKTQGPSGRSWGMPWWGGF